MYSASYHGQRVYEAIVSFETILVYIEWLSLRNILRLGVPQSVILGLGLQSCFPGSSRNSRCILVYLKPLLRQTARVILASGFRRQRRLETILDPRVVEPFVDVLTVWAGGIACGLAGDVGGRLAGLGPLPMLGVRGGFQLGSAGRFLVVGGTQVLRLGAYVGLEASAFAVGLGGEGLRPNGSGSLVLDGGVSTEVDLRQR